MNKNLGAGSLTLLMVAPGMPATGQATPSLDPAQYKNLTPEQRDKLVKALEARARSQQPSTAENPPGSIRTEVCMPLPIAQRAERLACCTPPNGDHQNWFVSDLLVARAHPGLHEC